jgi:hypothetical protein
MKPCPKHTEHDENEHCRFSFDYTDMAALEDDGEEEEDEETEMEMVEKGKTANQTRGSKTAVAMKTHSGERNP